MEHPLTPAAVPAYGFRHLVRPPQGGRLPTAFREDVARKVRRFHRQLPGYRPTDLVRLKNLARAWGLAEILVKDESTRFGLKAFKVLGGSYAVARLMCAKLGRDIETTGYRELVTEEFRRRVGRITLATATDGNHGRGVAWVAQQLRQPAVVFMPRGSARARVESIRAHGARVVVTDLNYDDTVRLAWQQARANGWEVVQDTAWEGYRDIPRWIMQGYLTLADEAADQMADQMLRPTHVFLQAGVGAFAGAMAGYLLNRYRDNPPRILVIEPNAAACLLASAASADGRPQAVGGDLATIMAGLACGEPNPAAWEILRDFAGGFFSCADVTAANGMRILAHPLANDPAVEAGESGAVGLGVLDLLINAQALTALKHELDIGPDATLLFFNTEGATDPGNYHRIIRSGRHAHHPGSRA
ncbi:MAG: diaminopropionate ammonia-lyase [Desulfobacterales bacterium]|nr:diaminopropionate ammonia-lyase [Desulfobacterales bacterium]MDJ0886152.1 diaminopropionate ammonia-lyase [Desulfobacterales bacterium]